MDKIVLHTKTNLVKSKLNILIKYRYINIQSLTTNESINIGIIWETDNHTFPIIKLINNLDFFHSLFPIFDVSHAEICINLIKIKYKLKKIKNLEMKITPTVRISNIKIHKQFYMHERPSNSEMEEILYKKYLTLSKTENKVNQLRYNAAESLKDIIFNTVNTLHTLSNSSSSTQTVIKNIKLKEKFNNKPLIFEEIVKLKDYKVKTHEDY